MSYANDSGSSNITIQLLREQYGIETLHHDYGPVTITSIALSLDDVTQGSLYIPSKQAISEDPYFMQAQSRGAYAVLVDRQTVVDSAQISIPVLFGSLSAQELGTLAATLYHYPAQAIAIFAIIGQHTERYASQLAYILHILGNPVGVISSTMTKSLDSDLHTHMPLSSVAMQKLLSVIVEDGAAAAVISVDQQTLQRGALSCIGVDICALIRDEDHIGHAGINEAAAYYGAVIGEKIAIATRTADSDELAELFKPHADSDELAVLSTCLAMVMAAGVRKNNIRSALKVAKEMD